MVLVYYEHCKVVQCALNCHLGIIYRHMLFVWLACGILKSVECCMVCEQGRKNVTKSEGASKTSTLSRAKTNPSRKHFYADLCHPRLGESFSV